MDASGHGHLMLHDKRTRDISLGVTGGWEQDEVENELEVGKTGFDKIGSFTAVNGSTAAAAASAGGAATTSFGSSVSSSTSDTTTAAAGTGGSSATTMTDRARRLLSISSLPDGVSAAAG
jgi:hypothetical protein